MTSTSATCASPASSSSFSSPALSDASFWERQDSVAPELDHPHMQSRPTRPSHPDVEVFVSSPAGKPLYHFLYNRTHPLHPLYNSKYSKPITTNSSSSPSSSSSIQPRRRPRPRPPASIASLSATLTAFQDATFNRVSVITTSHATIVSHVYSVLHIVIICKQKPIPHSFLNALTRTLISAIYFHTSLSLDPYLRANPTARPSFVARVAPCLDNVLLDVVSHPLSYALLKPVVLPSTCTPFNRRRLSEVTSTLMHAPPFRDKISYAVMFTSGPPFPCQLVMSCSPVNSPLTAMDLLILSSLSSSSSSSNTTNSNTSATCNTTTTTTTSDRSRSTTKLMHRDQSNNNNNNNVYYKVFPQACNFGKGFYLVSRHVELRLHPDHYDRFKAAVGGNLWRPEWTHRPPHSVTITLLVSSIDIATRFLNELELRLDRASDVTSLLISMERPLNLHPLAVHGVRDVIALHAPDRVAGTPTAFAYHAAICALVTAQRADRRRNARRGSGRESLFVHSFTKLGLRIVYWRGKIIVIFNLDESHSDEAAIHVTRNILVPQMNKYIDHIIPPDERVVVHAKTPLAGFLAPFAS